MLWRFLLCLAPVVLSLALIILSALEIFPSDSMDAVITACFLLSFIGAILSAVFVGIRVLKAIKEPLWVGILTAVIAGGATFIAYYTLAVLGGCGVVIFAGQ
jgi:hypothetical protein